MADHFTEKEIAEFRKAFSLFKAVLHSDALPGPKSPCMAEWKGHGPPCRDVSSERTRHHAHDGQVMAF